MTIVEALKTGKPFFHPHVTDATGKPEIMDENYTHFTLPRNTLTSDRWEIVKEKMSFNGFVNYTNESHNIVLGGTFMIALDASNRFGTKECKITIEEI